MSLLNDLKIKKLKSEIKLLEVKLEQLKIELAKLENIDGP